MRRIGAGKDLSLPYAVGRRLEGLDLRDGAGLPSPRMVDQKLCVHAKGLVERLLILQRKARQIAHGEYSQFAKPRRIPLADSPKVRDRLMVPELFPVRALIQLRDPDAVFIRFHVLGHDVHRYFGKVEIGPDSGRRGDPGLAQHVADHLHSQIVGRHPVGIQILRHVDEDLVDGVDVDVLRRDIAEVDIVDPGAVVHIESHAGLGRDEIEFQRGIRPQRVYICGLTRKRLHALSAKG